MIVAWNANHVFLAQTKGNGRFLSRAVRLIGGVNAKPREIAIGESKLSCRWSSFFACDRKRVHDPNRRRVVNHAFELLGQPNPLPQPIDHNGFKLSGHGTRTPRHRVHVQRRGENFTQNSWRGGSPAEVTEKHRVTPVHHAWNDDVIDVGENLLKRLAFFWCAFGKLLANSARLVVRRDAQSLDMLAKIRDPIREFMQLFAKFLRQRVTEIGWLTSRSLLPLLHDLCSH